VQEVVSSRLTSPTTTDTRSVSGSSPSSSTSFETGQRLLARILTERRQNWQGRGQYKESAALDTAKLFQLPAGWTWATLDSLAEIKGGITKDQGRKHTAPTRSVPYLRVANVQRGYIDLTEVKEIVTTEDEIQELTLKPGDILFNEGGDRDKLGRGWIWNGELPECIHQNHVFRARLYIAELSPKLVSWYANTFGQKFFFDEGKHTTNLASISMTKLKGLPVPIPPPAEQKRIVAEVERRLSVVEELETVVSANLQRATRLRQSVLLKAFTGGLSA
jgi:type I restriction enzyme S subunit